jgi:hypothetical protein
MKMYIVFISVQCNMIIEQNMSGYVYYMEIFIYLELFMICILPQLAQSQTYNNPITFPNDCIFTSPTPGILQCDIQNNNAKRAIQSYRKPHTAQRWMHLLEISESVMWLCFLCKWYWEIIDPYVWHEHNDDYKWYGINHMCALRVGVWTPITYRDTECNTHHYPQ